MHYEFYLDVFFLENFVINDLILRMTEKGVKCRSSRSRHYLASAVGAAGACLPLLVPVWKMAVASLAYSLCMDLWMLRIDFGKRKEVISGAVPVFFLTSFLLGGIWQVLMRMLKGKAYVSLLTGYVLAGILQKCWRMKKGRQRFLYETIISRREKCVEAKGLLDSGNRLFFPGSMDPVVIVDRTLADALLEREELWELECMMRMETVPEGTGSFTYIPYHSIGMERGLMPVMMLKNISIKHGEQVWDTGKIAAAVSRVPVSQRGEYQVILHPQILE